MSFALSDGRQGHSPLPIPKTLTAKFYQTVANTSNDPQAKISLQVPRFDDISDSKHEQFRLIK